MFLEFVSDFFAFESLSIEGNEFNDVVIHFFPNGWVKVLNIENIFMFFLWFHQLIKRTMIGAT